MAIENQNVKKAKVNIDLISNILSVNSPLDNSISEEFSANSCNQNA